MLFNCHAHAHGWYGMCVCVSVWCGLCQVVALHTIKTEEKPYRGQKTRSIEFLQI